MLPFPYLVEPSCTALSLHADISNRVLLLFSSVGSDCYTENHQAKMSAEPEDRRIQNDTFGHD